MIAIIIQAARSVNLEAGLRVLLGIKLLDFHPVSTDRRDERDVVGLAHCVRDRHVKLILHTFDFRLMLLVGLLGFQGGRIIPQQLTTASPVLWITLPQTGHT